MKIYSCKYGLTQKLEVDGMNRNGFVKCGNIIVGMYGDVCCNKTGCPHRSIVGRCNDINAECEREEDRNEALLKYMFADDNEVEFELEQKFGGLELGA